MAQQATIFALSSGQGRAGIAVIRVSGPRAGAALERLAGSLPKPRFAALRTLRNHGGEPLDSALALWLPAPRSETGEDMAELHVHGGRAVIAGVLEALGAVAGCRLAEPGEFARRAFENGKIDLTAAEALADLVDADTAGQRRQALRQAGGSLARLYDGWRATLIEAQALTESAIDFADEADVSERAMVGARELVARLAPTIRAHLDDGRRGEILRQGLHVAIAGPPNAGKSSLLNALARREAAIVSEEAGTTRDIIEVTLDLAGVPVILSDTAGIREAEGRIEREGVRRAVAHARAADLVLWLTDASTVPELPPADLEAGEVALLRVSNKTDLLGDASAPVAAAAGGLRISVRTGAGLSELIAAIAERAGAAAAASDAPVLTQARHRQLLELCTDALDAYLAGDPEAAELRAEDLRRAAAALGRITGRVDVEDVLGAIFGRFCIGK
ncbi:MAG TPA: tRNA uridine-5-carboxymethylaminomethyl(34) synthesis GTPase MnmE [Hyphomicrobiaceae bacterium]|nr:tRNA uridine-5-carboxymethylaminomethyl(34) synthesis GTPase MnmE [Hyphomicrobiaceae bacterium]